MNRIRGEEQPGFVQILHNWLPHQPWFPSIRGRIRLTRVGGLRLPAPTGDSDPGLLAELHIFDVDQSGLAENEEPVRISVPITLRSRPSALAGKSAFIGKLTTEEHTELWLYDGAGDHAFLAAWVEMARRRQGSRTGRARGEALAGFSQWEPFTAQVKRQILPSPVPHATRTLLVTDGQEENWEHMVTVDILRRPMKEHDANVETVRRLTAAHCSVVPRVLGTISGAWEDRRFSSAEFIEWETGLLSVIREPGAQAPDALTLARSALSAAEPFDAEAEMLGRTLGTFHADLAGSFGAYPQSPEQLKTLASRDEQALADQWAQVRGEFDDDHAAELTDTIEQLTIQLREADEPLMLQTIHGALELSHFHQLTAQRWVINEHGGMLQHAAGLGDVVTVLVSLANAVMEAESPSSAEGPPDTASPVHGVATYQKLAAAFLEGYRTSDADAAGVGTIFFRARMLTEALKMTSGWERGAGFRPSIFLRLGN